MRNLHLLIPLCLFFTIDSLAQKKNKTEVNYLDKISLNGLKWRSVGPALTSGRVSDIAVNPNNPFEYYVAVASGGVWKTSNWGLEYIPVFDSEDSYSIGCAIIDPNKSKVVWVGTEKRTTKDQWLTVTEFINPQMEVSLGRIWD